MTENCNECGKVFDSYRAMRVHQSRVGHMEKPWRDEDKMRELYVHKGLSGYEIAEQLDCGQNAVYSALDDFGITRRKQGDTKRMKASRKPANFRTHSRDGYEEIYTSTEGKNFFARVHRLAAVAWFGLDAVNGSVIHHKNGIQWDNREENIELMDSQKEHAKLHNETRKRDESGRYK